MTAKELKEVALTTVWKKHPISGEILGITRQGYVFNEDNMRLFCEQLCREQRHECQIERNKRSKYIDGIWYVACEDVLNTEMPDL